MSYRDSKGRSSKNPYQFLQSTNKYKVPLPPKISEDRIKELLFELEWAKEESKTLSEEELLNKYLAFYLELKSKKAIGIKEIRVALVPQFRSWFTLEHSSSFFIKLNSNENVTRFIEAFYLEIYRKYIHVTTYKYNEYTFTSQQSRAYHRGGYGRQFIDNFNFL